MSDSPVTIFHNPACGTSRNTLAAIRETGQEPRVVEYLKAGWSEAQLRDLFARAGLAPREALRRKAPGAEALLADGVPDETILQAMVADPVLVERPFVVTPKGVRLCRPTERLREVL